MLLRAAGFIVTTIIAVLLVVANNIGTDANQALLLAAAVLTVVLILILIALGVRRVRRRRPPFFFGVVPVEGRPPTPADPAPVTTVLPATFDKIAGAVGREAPRQRTAMPALSWKDMSPEQAQDRDSLQRDARGLRDTYRVVARTNQIDDLGMDEKRSMQARVDEITSRLVAYREGWGFPAMDVSDFVPEGQQLGPAWLRAMIRELDVVIWQLDDRYE